MKLNRRNVLAGLGTAAAGTAAVFGTGAWVSEESTRELDVTITDDDGENVQLPIGLPTDTNERVRLDENDGVDVLTIDAENLPDDASVSFGEFGVSELPDSEDVDTDTLETGAFTITNNNAFDSAIDLTVELADDSLESDISLVVDDGETAELVDDEAEPTFEDIGDDEIVDVGIWIETAADEFEDESVDITLTAEANQ